MASDAVVGLHEFFQLIVFCINLLGRKQYSGEHYQAKKTKSQRRAGRKYG
jgi:hypothetical protein